MSKIKVVRVPSGLLIALNNEDDAVHIGTKDLPALLAALLKDAGAVKMLLTCSLTYLEISGDAELPIGEYPVYVLPIPKDTKE